jgi:beta-glucanase (GH16 family)
MGYHQAFRDDFDTLNRGVWDNHIWYDGPPSSAWTNFQYAQNGILHLATSRNYSCGSGCSYPNNTVTTQTSGKTFKYGYFEASMKWTKGNGAWPGFWLLSYRHATNPSWPSVNPICSQLGEPASHCYAGELDIFEGQGSEPQAFYGTIHRNSCNCYGVGDQQNGNNWQPGGVDLTAGFHTYGMLWTPTQVSWYLDGRLMLSTTPYDSLNQPMFLLLQMWTGGWTHDPDSTTPSTIETQVDYIQVWQKSG